MSPVSHDPRTGHATGAPNDSSPLDVDDAALRAAAAAKSVGETPPRVRALWLNALADGLQAESATLCETADSETALGSERLTGELQRTADALRFYAYATAQGSWLDATIDRATPTTPDLRRINRALGPVAVFGASNFPFAFGVLGHDTATALAAGCPVLVKAHPAHPRLSAQLNATAQSALEQVGAPAGAFAVVFGREAGAHLVTHGDVRAVAFTGSEAGGLALWRLAATRERPIPVYAEMGTVNTVVVTRAAAIERADAIAAGFVASFTLGMGQFCTKPGLLAVPTGSNMTARVGAALADAAPEGWLLTSAIADSYAVGVGNLIDAGASVVATTAPSSTGWNAAPTVLSVPADQLARGSHFLNEVFGPVAAVVEYRDDAELHSILDALPGSLAAGVQAGNSPDPELAHLINRLSDVAGRIVVNGWPTGVAVNWAQHHGGPWPATTVPSATSVGAAAIHRFLRPVAYQNVGDASLPPALQDANPWALPRRVDGRL